MAEQVMVLMTVPVRIELVTEDIPLRQEVDEFDQLVDVYRIRQVNLINDSGKAWSLALYRDGQPVYVQEVTVGMVRSFTIQSNRRFELTRYSVSVSVVR